MRAAAASPLGLALLALLARLAAGASSPGFDYLMLSRQWGPTFCELNSCSGNAQTYDAFTIHGLWPSDNNGNSPSYCDPSNKFSTKNLASNTLSQMNCEWPSMTGSNEGFWGSEWAKHGTCALSLFPSQQQYFSTALQLADKYDLDATLTSAGIDLQSSQVSPAAVTSAVQKAWGVPPTLVCVQSMLFEVRTCFDTALRIIKCPTNNQCSASKDQNLPEGSSPLAPSCAPYFAPGGAGGSSGSSSTGAASGTTSGAGRTGASGALAAALAALAVLAAL